MKNEIHLNKEMITVQHVFWSDTINNKRKGVSKLLTLVFPLYKFEKITLYKFDLHLKLYFFLVPIDRGLMSSPVNVFGKNLLVVGLITSQTL